MFAAEKRAKNYEVLIREYEAGDCGGIRKERSRVGRVGSSAD